MPAKSKSPEAAQRKVWKQELQQLNAADRQVKKQWRDEKKRLLANCKKADAELNKFMRRAEKQMPRDLGKIDSRRAVLRGRLGL